MLWRWSTTVQVASCLLITVFFAVFARSARSAETRVWVSAWLWNCAALLVTALFWLMSDNAARDYLLGPLRFVYLGTKLLFVVTLLHGAAVVASPARRPHDLRPVAHWSLALYALAGAIFCSTIPQLGLVGSAAIACLMIGGGIWSFRSSIPGGRWLAIGLIVRGSVAALEGFAYASQIDGMIGLSGAAAPAVSLFLSASSSFDSGAEWLVALGCVLVSMHRARAELMLTNRELLLAQDSLRALADRDPLTGLLNRRALTMARASIEPAAAQLAFFDLDDFKRINDVHGHAVGDATLVRFADALRAGFRAEDLVYRYAGDEFLVIAHGLSTDAIVQRVDAIRDALRTGWEHRLDFSFGTSELAPGTSVEEAIRVADGRMYAAKVRSA